MYMWALEKYFSAYPHCALGEALDDWTSFVTDKLSQHAMRDALMNARKMSRANTVAEIAPLADRLRTLSSGSTQSKVSHFSSASSETSSSGSGRPAGSIKLELFPTGAVQLVWGTDEYESANIHASFRWIYPNLVAALVRVQQRCDADDFVELGQLLLEAKTTISLIGERRLVQLAKAFILFILQVEVEAEGPLIRLVHSKSVSKPLAAASANSSRSLVRAETSPMEIQSHNHAAAPVKPVPAPELCRFDLGQIQELVEPLLKCGNVVKSLGSLNSVDFDAEDLSRIGSELASRATVKVSFFGARSVGKSTLLNALLDRPLAYLSANESTGCVTEMCHCPEGVEEHMEVVFISLDEFASMRAEMREKVRWMEDQIGQMREQQQQQLMSAVAGAVDTQGTMKISSTRSGPFLQES